MPTTGMSTSASVPGSSMNGWSRGTSAETSSPSMQATFSPLSPSSRAISIVRSAAARGLAAPMLVIMTVPAARQAGSSALHAALEMRIIAARRIGHAVAVAEGDGALAQAFQHHGVELAALDQIDRRLEPVGGKARAGADAEA